MSTEVQQVATAEQDYKRPNPRLLTIVVPAFNEAKSLPKLVERLEAVFGPTGIPFEAIVVDDGSKDGTLATLTELRIGRPWLCFLRFSRNFGKEIALAAGLRAARGEVVVQLDADLQHPPELVHRFIEAWREGADLVYGARDRGAEQGGLRDLLARAFYRIFDYIAEIRLLPGAGDFALFDRKVVDALNAMPERNRFGKGLYAWVGFERRAIPYVPDERADGGGSRWSLRRLVGLAVDGITSFSTFPLRVWSVFGAVISLISFVFGAWIVADTLISGNDVPGYPSVMAGIAFLGGIQLITLGVLGEYLGQVFMEVKRRPLYVIDRKVGFDDEEADWGPRYEVRARTVAAPGDGTGKP